MPQILLDEGLGHEGGEAGQPVLQPCQRLQAETFFFSFFFQLLPFFFPFDVGFIWGLKRVVPLARGLRSLAESTPVCRAWEMRKLG